jgi:hypothetical protein
VKQLIAPKCSSGSDVSNGGLLGAWMLMCEVGGTFSHHHFLGLFLVLRTLPFFGMMSFSRIDATCDGYGSIRRISFRRISFRSISFRRGEIRSISFRRISFRSISFRSGEIRSIFFRREEIRSILPLHFAFFFHQRTTRAKVINILLFAN